MKEFVVTADIARRRDYFNIHVSKLAPQVLPGSQYLGTEERVVHMLKTVHIEKYQGITYEESVDRLETIMRHADLSRNSDLLVDGTGVGDSVIELIRKRGLNPMPIIFTGAGQVREIVAPAGAVFKTAAGQPELSRLAIVKEIHVPKEDLVHAGVLLMEERRIQVVPTLYWAADFKAQLVAFRGKVNERTKKTSYNAATEADHDDEVVCYLMAAWWMTRAVKLSQVREGPIRPGPLETRPHRPFMED